MFIRISWRACASRQLVARRLPPLPTPALNLTLVPESATADALATTLRQAMRAGARVLYPRSATGRDVLPNELRAAGFDVLAIDAYRTLPEPNVDQRVLDRVRRGEVDLITFASPSSVRHVVGLLGPDCAGLNMIPVICAGPVTAQAAREAGLLVTAVSESPDTAAMSNAIAAFWQDAGRWYGVCRNGDGGSRKECRVMRLERNNPQAASLPDFRRTRRLRGSAAVRGLVRETAIGPDDFIQPLFITHGTGIHREIGSMPGQFQLSVDVLPREIAELAEAGIKAVLLFGIPEEKDRYASGAFDADGVVQRAMRTIKRELPEMLVIGDVCACEYTDHGHCGILDGCEVDNDRTVELLARIAVSQADAGADVVAPSDMMDGRVVAIRAALDAAGHVNLPIMSYAVKYASAFYGPFREAAASMPAFGDRRSHQMDPANAREALTEIAIDLDEGADVVIVKPAMAYLDVIRMARDAFDAPIVAYNVSGEYAMIKAAAQLGWIDERRVAMETLTSIKRAGAGRIITYHAKDAAMWLREGEYSSRRAVDVLSEWEA